MSNVFNSNYAFTIKTKSVKLYVLPIPFLCLNNKIDRDQLYETLKNNEGETPFPLRTSFC